MEGTGDPTFIIRIWYIPMSYITI